VSAGPGSPEAPHPVFRNGGLSYLRIPAPDPLALAGFYVTVFGWRVRTDGDAPAFEDGSGHVIGHFRADLAVAGTVGFTPYVFVADLDATLATAAAEGGILFTAPYAEGDLWVATLLDPAGNLVGLWQRGPRGEGAG